MAVMDEALDRALQELRGCLDALRLPLVDREAAHAQALARTASAQITDHVLPRLRRIEAPLLTVVSGSTGAGKSTVVNSLVGHEVTAAGVLRPTTRLPVLVHHPDDLAWFADDRILGALARVSGPPSPAQGCWPGSSPAGAPPPGLRLVADPAVPAGLALLDAPDIDSVESANRELAATLMAAADLWLFLTTAARYADAVPWTVLRSAVARDAAVALVLNRVPHEAVGPVSDHLRAVLADEGLGAAPLFVVEEVALRDGLLPAARIDPVRGWLANLAGDAASRAAVARRTLDGALTAMGADLGGVADAADRQVLVAARLGGSAGVPFDAAAARIAELTADGSLLRGEVLARWQEFVGAGEAFRRLESSMARARDRLTRAMRGEQAPADVGEALGSGLAGVLVDEVARAREQAVAAWADDPAGMALLDGRDLAAVPADLAEQTADVVHGWQADVLELVRSEGAGRRASARALAYGVNGSALALMVVVFSATGGITGAEVGIAGGAAVLAQKVLEAVFSDDAVRRMSSVARERLDVRVGALLAMHRHEFDALLEESGVDPAAGPALRAALGAVAQARPAPAPVDLPPAPVPAQARRGMRRWRRERP